MGYELHEAGTLYSWLLHSEGDWQPCNETKFKEPLAANCNYQSYFQQPGTCCIIMASDFQWLEN